MGLAPNARPHWVSRREFHMNVEIGGRVYTSVEQMREREDNILRAVREGVTDSEHERLNAEWAELSGARIEAQDSNEHRREAIRSAATRPANREGGDTTLAHEHRLAADPGFAGEARQQGLRCIERMAPV